MDQPGPASSFPAVELFMIGEVLRRQLGWLPDSAVPIPPSNDTVVVEAQVGDTAVIFKAADPFPLASPPASEREVGPALRYLVESRLIDPVGAEDVSRLLAVSGPRLRGWQRTPLPRGNVGRNDLFVDGTAVTTFIDWGSRWATGARAERTIARGTGCKPRYVLRPTERR